jgi:TalC/MipB family fructose-6-phosphate aldolase
MKQLFLDTANLSSIKYFNNKGIISGVTTNPSLFSKEPKQNFDLLIKEIWKYCANNDLSFSIEVFTSDPKEINNQAQKLYSDLLKINNKLNLLYIKIPIGINELECIKYLNLQGMNINCTCCYNTTQMELACLAGAKYVSLFYRRCRDMGEDPNVILTRTKKFILDNNLDTKIIAGSIRSGLDIQDAWEYGADIVTSGPQAIEDGLNHEGTTKSINQFVNDFQNWIG